MGQMIHIKICPWKCKAMKRTVLDVLSSRELKNYSKKRKPYGAKPERGLSSTSSLLHHW